jgi:TonB-linked SusC/RagA family outer membrane protein
MGRRGGTRRGLALACWLIGVMAGRLGAQDGGHPLQLADGGPRFYAVASGAGGASERVDARNAVVFRKQIEVSFQETSLRQALSEIARQAGVRLSVSGAVVALDQPVSFSASRISVGAALTAVLYDAGVDVLLAADGTTMAIVPRGGVKAGEAERAKGVGGTISGSVTDSITRETVPRVAVSVLETGQTTKTNGEGQYAIVDVAPGQYHVKVMRVGFIVKTRVVEVRDGATSTLNFAMSRPATELDEVVTTGAGDQRRFTLGNEVSSINVDSLTPTAPVTSVTDVLTSRVPGLQVIESGGLTGGGEAIRIWGQSSALLQSDPIIIVDGVRQDNTPGGSPGGLQFYATPTPSRLNDIDFSQIESIDVLKGPAASTEYGTDAANGVIIIKTKRGTSGKPQWHASIEDGASTIPTDYPDFYYSYGHLTDGSRSPVECPIVASVNWGIPSSSSGACTVDSLVHGNPLDHPATTFYGTGSRQKYALDLGGGSDAIRYFVAGSLSNEIGAIKVPDVFVPAMQAAGFPSSVYNPNSENQRSGRTNLFFNVGSKADITVSAAYLSTYQAGPSVGQNGSGLLDGAARGGSLDAANNYGYGFTNNPVVTNFSSTSSQQTDRFTGGLVADWRPVSWLAAYADAGIDHGSQSMLFESWPQVFQYLYGQAGTANGGSYDLIDGTTDTYSADLRVSATATLTPAIRALTTLGVNMRDTRQGSLEGAAQELSSQNMSLAGAPSPSLSQAGSRNATLGGYAEEQLQFVDRVFLTGALRADGASGFGKNYQAAVYPKVSFSWLAVQQSGTTVRFRSAFGASGQQPYNGLTLQLYQPIVAAIGSYPVSSMYLSQVGNPNLKPERSTEWEGGTDLAFWGNRLSMAFTAYQKTTTDALYNAPLGFDLANYTQTINIGEITNGGLEASVTAVPIQSDAVSWTVSVNASTNHNKLVHLEAGLSPLWFGNGAYGVQQIKAGYPLYGYWGTTYSYPGAVSGGFLTSNQVTVANAPSYLGSSIPTQQAAFSTHVAVLHNTLSLGMVFTYQGGYKVYDGLAQAEDQYGTTEGLNVPGAASLATQARVIASNLNQNYTPAGYFYDGTVWRFQELSLTYALPGAWARAVRMHSLSLTGAVRNLAFWTRYPDGDPASSFSVFSSETVGTTTFNNNDVRESSTSAVPLARYYQFRLNVGF